MKLMRLLSLFLPVLATSCATMDQSGTLASLRDVKIELKEERIEGSLDKAMESYRKFLEETPESALTPEAIRRLADLKVEKEYGTALEETSKSTNVLPSTDDAVSVFRSCCCADSRSYYAN